MWFSGSGKRRAYASIHIMKIRMFVIDAIFEKLLYTFVFANAEKLFYYDLHVYAFVCECYDVMVTIPRVELDICILASKGHYSQPGARYIPANNGHCPQHGARYILASNAHCPQRGARYILNTNGQCPQRGATNIYILASNDHCL